MHSVFLLLILLAGCSVMAPRPDPQPADQIWMVQHIMGGQQCNPHVAFNPPNIKLSLEEDGIELLEYIEVGRATCRACTCPAYSKDHFVLIYREDIERVAQVGFEPSDQPPPL